MKMFSNQTCSLWPTSPLSSQVNALWNVQGALQLPCCIVFKLYVPWGMENIVLGTSLGLTCICSYVSGVLIFDQYLALMTDSWISLISGMGVTSSIIFELQFLASITVLSEPSVFQMHSSGHACSLDVGNHHPAFM